MVKMKANDTLHISSAGSENILPGGEFEVTEEVAKSLEDRELAKRVGGTKAEKAAPENKMEAEPANKVIGAGGIKEQRTPVTPKRKGK